MKRAAIVVADSTQTKRDLVDFTHIDPDKVIVIHPGLNQSFAPQPEDKLALRRRFGFGSGPVLLQIGRGFYKNLPCVIRVLNRLRNDGIDACVARVGPSLFGTERALAERLGVLAHIVELGAVADPDLPALYNAVDCCCFHRCTRDSAGRRWKRWPPARRSSARGPVRSTRWSRTRR